MRGSGLQKFFLKRSSSQLIANFGAQDCVGVDASWMMQKYLQAYRSDIQTVSITRAVHEFIQRVKNLEEFFHQEVSI